MKRQKKFRFLSLLLCCMFLLFAGCEFGGGGEIDGTSTQSLAGAKVLSRPADYSFSDAVGNFSENYYNLFAREIMAGLYNSYNNMGYTPGEKEFYLKEIDKNNGFTIGEESDNKYYLYDSIRYTITDVKTVRESGYIMSQTITLDFSKDWNWNLPYDAIGKKIVFYNTPNFEQNVVSNVNNNIGTYTLDIDKLMFDGDWTQLYKDGLGPNYLSVYDSNNGVDGTEKDSDGNAYKDYWLSPYYNKDKDGNEVTGLQNYYQDALEYATYLFVLGYDYSIEADAPYFDFTPDFNSADGSVNDVKVNYEGENISVVDALGKVKARYNEVGNYVGLTDKNREQLAKFIRDKVIGIDSPEKFQVSFTNFVKDTTTGAESSDTEHANETLNFNRNYDKIIENIISYACEKAPIGIKSDGTPLTLGNNYPVSQITDYEADNFFLNYNTPDGKNDEKNEYLFHYVPTAEYQSFVLYPLADQISKDGNLKYIHDLWLAFEYNEEVAGKTMLDALQINVGVRYYSKSANGYTVTAQTSTPLSITRGKNTDGVWGDNTCYIGYSEKEQGQYQIATPSDFSFKTDFNRDIGEGAIDPRIDGEAVDGGYRKLITGTSKAKDYYQLNNSSSYGSFVTLNPAMFAGEDGCDYMEIYFDIVKDKSQNGVNYNFKVAIGLFGAYSPEELGMRV
ncbi:MAG: hypothetical protein ACI4R8_01485 [Candidatus Caccovivens sp.]